MNEEDAVIDLFRHRDGGQIGRNIERNVMDCIRSRSRKVRLSLVLTLVVVIALVAGLQAEIVGLSAVVSQFIVDTSFNVVGLLENLQTIAENVL